MDKKKKITWNQLTLLMKFGIIGGVIVLAYYSIGFIIGFITGLFL
jgi:hypothetical protein